MKQLTMQEWADVTGLYATCSDAGHIILHEKLPTCSQYEMLKRKYKYIWESTGRCCYLIRDMVGGEIHCDKVYEPKEE